MHALVYDVGFCSNTLMKCGSWCLTGRPPLTYIMQLIRPGVTNLFAIAGRFVSYRWVSGPHNFLVIL